MTPDYACFFRRKIGVDSISAELPFYDVFISAYNSNERVTRVFGEVRAARKIWVIHPEYKLAPLDFPKGFECISPESLDEVRQVAEILNAVGDLQGKNVAIDITGFMRHVLVFLTVKLKQVGLAGFDALYSEPDRYTKQEQTSFTTTTTGIVRPIRGMRGENVPTANEYLLVGVGFDHRLIGEVANNKDNSTVYPIFAFPPLSPDMYQQSVMKVSESGDVAQRAEWTKNRRFAPANDPFSTAAIVSELVRNIRRGGDANIYLSPLSTKAQVLGFALYWCYEVESSGAVSMLLPECEIYSRETSEGMKRLWCYSVEF